MVERLDRPIGTGEHHTALERGHYVKGSRFRSRAPIRCDRSSMHRRKRDTISSATSGDRTPASAPSTPQRHIRPSSIESRSERRSVSEDRVFGSLVRPPRNRSKEPVSVTPGDSSSHRGLGGEMVMHARALDADLGRKVAKAEAPVSGVADMGLGQVHQSFSGLTHVRVEPVSIDR